jgi:hypothetical protein
LLAVKYKKIPLAHRNDLLRVSEQRYSSLISPPRNMLVKILLSHHMKKRLRAGEDEEIISCLLERDFYMLLKLMITTEDVCGMLRRK